MSSTGNAVSQVDRGAPADEELAAHLFTGLLAAFVALTLGVAAFSAEMGFVTREGLAAHQTAQRRGQ